MFSCSYFVITTLNVFFAHFFLTFLYTYRIYIFHAYYALGLARDTNNINLINFIKLTLENMFLLFFTLTMTLFGYNLLYEFFCLKKYFVFT